MNVRITLINHDEVIVLGVATMLARHARHIEVVDLRGRPQERVDVALHDPRGSVGSEPAVLDRLLADPRLDRVVAFTGAFEPATADTLFQRGYDGYLSTALTHQELIDCLGAVHDGQRVLAPAATEQSDPQPGQQSGKQSGQQPGEDEEAWPGQSAGLTAREADVLSLISAGLSNKEIADQLGVTVNSVKSYIRGAYRTIDVDSRTKAVLWGVTHGLRTPTVALTESD